MLTMVCILMASQQDLAEILVPGGHQQRASIYNFLHLAEILIDPLKLFNKILARCEMQDASFDVGRAKNEDELSIVGWRSGSWRRKLTASHDHTLTLYSCDLCAVERSREGGC